jgi:hypothetical protein
MCPMAHGPWEAGLHPDAYRTNLCAYGHECKRRMCFFAHDNSELRTPSSSQQMQQAAAVVVPTAHVQGGRLHSTTENVLRGTVPLSHTSADATGKRGNTVTWASPSGGMSGSEGQGVFFSAQNRDEYGEVTGRFRQLTVDPLMSDGGYEAAELPCQSLPGSQQSALAEFPHFEVYDCSGSGQTTIPAIQTAVDSESEERAASANLRRRNEGKARSSFLPSVPPISEDSSTFNASFGGMHTSLVRNIGDVGRPAEDGAVETSDLEMDQMFATPNDVPDERDSSKSIVVKRNLQVNIPATRLPNPPGVSPTETMLKQDTSWVDKLLESPIEAQHFGARLKFPAP